MFSLITLYYQKCNCQPLLIENSAHTWRLKIFKLVFVYAHRLFAFFCLCPPPFFYPPPKKNFSRARKIFCLSPPSPRSRTAGYLLSCPPLSQRCGVDFLSPPHFFSIFPIPAAFRLSPAQTFTAGHVWVWVKPGVHPTEKK